VLLGGITIVPVEEYERVLSGLDRIVLAGPHALG
jgi:hypothetical protein